MGYRGATEKWNIACFVSEGYHRRQDTMWAIHVVCSFAVGKARRFSCDRRQWELRFADPFL